MYPGSACSVCRPYWTDVPVLRSMPDQDCDRCRKRQRRACKRSGIERWINPMNRRHPSEPCCDNAHSLGDIASGIMVGVPGNNVQDPGFAFDGHPSSVSTAKPGAVSSARSCRDVTANREPAHDLRTTVRVKGGTIVREVGEGVLDGRAHVSRWTWRSCPKRSSDGGFERTARVPPSWRICCRILSRSFRSGTRGSSECVRSAEAKAERETTG